MTELAAEIFGAHYDVPEHLWLRVHFAPSATSQAAGHEFLKRKLLRQENRDPEVNGKVAPAQVEALGKYGMQYDGVLDYLKDIKQPTLIVQGNNDVIAPTVNSYTMQQNMPNAQLILYPDSNHGSLFQYADLFVKQVNLFLNNLIAL